LEVGKFFGHRFNVAFSSLNAGFERLNLGVEVFHVRCQHLVLHVSGCGQVLRDEELDTVTQGLVVFTVLIGGAHLELIVISHLRTAVTKVEFHCPTDVGGCDIEWHLADFVTKAGQFAAQLNGQIHVGEDRCILR